MNNILIGILIWNVIVFLIYRSDKIKAIKRERRIRERTLIICALLCGGFGAALGMYGLRHKTKHTKFKIFVPISFVITLGVILLLIIYYN